MYIETVSFMSEYMSEFRWKKKYFEYLRRYWIIVFGLHYRAE